RALRDNRRGLGALEQRLVRRPIDRGILPGRAAWHERRHESAQHRAEKRAVKFRYMAQEDQYLGAARDPDCAIAGGETARVPLQIGPRHDRFSAIADHAAEDGASSTRKMSAECGEERIVRDHR